LALEINCNALPSIAVRIIPPPRNAGINGAIILMESDFKANNASASTTTTPRIGSKLNNAYGTEAS